MPTGRDIIKEILRCEDIDLELTISVDISTGENDAGRRVFTAEFFEVNDTRSISNEIVLLFSGSIND